VENEAELARLLSHQWQHALMHAPRELYARFVTGELVNGLQRQGFALCHASELGA
jgi:hypothetical protein